MLCLQYVSIYLYLHLYNSLCVVILVSYVELRMPFLFSIWK